jgi:hypothetical protein
MIIMACHDLGSPLQVFNMVIFEDIMSIFITSAILKLIQGMVLSFLLFGVRKIPACYCADTDRYDEKKIYWALPVFPPFFQFLLNTTVIFIQRM